MKKKDKIKHMYPVFYLDAKDIQLRCHGLLCSFFFSCFRVLHVLDIQHLEKFLFLQLDWWLLEKKVSSQPKKKNQFLTKPRGLPNFGSRPMLKNRQEIKPL